MAEMFPPECNESTPSAAERNIFKRIRNETGGDWVGLHSVGIAQHKRKPWAEIDFVLIGPQGIFCLEVKGGRVARQGGLWHFTDREGNTTSKAEGPFEQVASAAAALRRHISESDPELRHVPVGWGVITPDIHFEVTGPDIQPRVLLDERERERPFSAYLRRLADFWHEDIERITGHPSVGLDEKQRRKALNVIRCDFDLRPSLRTRAGVIREELLTLTEEQYRVLDGLRDNPRSVIRGYAGSGKTLLALEEARRRASNGERVLICCRTPRLGAFLRQATAHLPNIDCYDLRSFMVETINAANLSESLPKAQEADLFSIFLPEACVEGLMINDRLQTYDMLIVDEAQDLLAETFVEVFDALLKGGVTKGRWMLFLDPNQDVFEAISPAGWKPLLQTNPAQFRLTLNCRNTRPIGVAAQILSGVTISETLRVDGPDVEQYFYTSGSDMGRALSNCIKRWLGEGIKPSQIVVLSTRPFMNSQLKNGLIGVTCCLMDSKDRTVAENEIGFYQVTDFKGLEADMVAVVDVDDLESAAALLSVYVGASRARIGLAVFLSEEVRGAYNRQAVAYGKSAQFL